MNTAAALPCVFIFAKDPVAGAVKTRLAAAIGAGEALAFYVTTLANLVRRLGAAPEWRTVLAVTPDDALASDGLAGFAVERTPQGNGDLGERMARQLAAASADAPVLIVGSDVPELDARHIHAALDVLNACDLVLGPSPDGGYWLIGASRPPPPQLFDGVRWSSPQTLQDTLANAAALKVGLLESLEDVDDEASWRRARDAKG